MTQSHLVGKESILVTVFLCAMGVCGEPVSSSKEPVSCCPAIDQAAAAYAENRFDDARAGFESVLNSTNLPPLVRAMAYVGLAKTALAKGDVDTAVAVWKRQISDSSLPKFYREQAKSHVGTAKNSDVAAASFSRAARQTDLPELPAPAMTFHVAPQGSDANDGSECSPFATLERARAAIRAVKKSNGGTPPKGGITVVIEPGDYRIERTFTLTGEDSGSADAPIVYRGKGGALARFRGGILVKHWRPITDAAVKSRLSPGVADSVLEADLNALGVRDFGDATQLRKRPELFVNGIPQVLARWPNDGFVKTGDILGTNVFNVWGTIKGCKDGRFRFVEERPLSWLDEPDVRLYGYWFWDWYEEYQRVSSIDPGQRSLVLAEPYSNYGYRKDQRYYAVNVLRELDQSCEWYLDRRAGFVYWLPPANVWPETAEVVLSVFDQPFFDLNEAKHVVVMGLAFQEGRGDAVHISGGADCLVAGCAIRQMGGDGIVIKGGWHHGIFGCLIETMGCGGTRVDGGNRKSLEPGKHYVENCVVRNISRLKRTYAPAVHMDGCGNRIAHNLFEDIPSSAMRIEGNDHIVEFNIIRDVVKESDDQGGVDMFGNPLYRGVVIRWNRWVDIRGGTHTGAAGVRLDDMISGVVVYGNVFERCGSAMFGGVQIHGGKDNLVDNNLFLDCFAGVSFSRWGEKLWLERAGQFFKEAETPHYLDRYPELANLRTGADVNYLSRNIFVRCGEVFLRDGGVPRVVLSGVIAEAIDPGALELNGAWDKARPFRERLFDAIPLSLIGPYDHPWRAR